MTSLPFCALRRGPITLHLINADNFPDVRRMFTGFTDSAYMLREMDTSYLPKYDTSGRRILFGFYAMLDGELAGGSLLGISDWDNLHGFTGADTLLHMRGRGVAPGSKPHLFYLGFHRLGLNRIETGCFVSNKASRRSIEKTPGFVYEGTLRRFSRNEQGEFEDERRYAILREDWVKLYNPTEIEEIDSW
ncbi:MAG: GNAT family N-acetyltransferase [Anaerolineae bacterium]|nr:GNAT family N-acetyltransferase [Anaerolineae bacterium]